jgi:predicted ATPase/class 3 adenylate cyclase/tetratricopeptide (TPR) repeat protein
METRALLLTDVVGSTQLSERLGDTAMADVWAEHDRAARDLLPLHSGLEIDKTDGMLLLFEKTADAVAYAMDYHRALAALAVPLQARAGLHVGAVILRENSAEDVARGAKPLEVDGLAKPMAARVMSLAQGGQTLLTEQARYYIQANAQSSLSDDLKVQSHGHWLLKGVADPIELFEVGALNASFTLPPDSDKVHRVVRSQAGWVGVQEIANNLPQQTTSFIGREREQAELKTLLSSARLLTLLGMGGLGKTRLSLHVAANVMADFPDGIWFIDLAPIRDETLVVSNVAQVLGVREEPDRSLLHSVCAHLKPRRSLLIFDNCEHLIQPAADLANALLRAAPHLRVMASSREALRIPGEQAYPVHPLPVPGRGDSLEALSQSTAVRLFVERAQQHKPSFALNAREAPAVVELVARLEGIPLALELAAARVRSLTVAEINTRLTDRYKLLTGGGRVLQERQQTLRALVDWSYELLTENEQTVLMRLSVFAGGFDLAAAEHVCGDEPLSPDDVLDLLTSLIEKSIVMMEEREDATRYRMLETIRDYALEKAQLAGGMVTTAARHCEHFAALAADANRGLKGPEQATWLWRLEVELDNIRAAMAVTFTGSVDAFIAVKMSLRMLSFWMLRGYVKEGRRFVKAALELPAIQASDLAQGHALYVSACLATSQSDHAEARAMLEICLNLRRRLGNAVDIAATLSTLSLARLQAGDAEGAAAAEHEALDIFRDVGDRLGEAIGLLHLGEIAVTLGDEIRAKLHLLQGLSVARELRNQEAEGECQLALGRSAFGARDLAQARLWLTRSLTVCREAGDKRGEANAVWWLGKCDLDAGDTVAAQARLDEAVKAFRAFGMREEVLGCLEDHAVLMHACGHSELTLQIAAAAAHSRQRLSLARTPPAETAWQSQLAGWRQAMSDAGFEAEWQIGAEWSVDQAIAAATTPQRAPEMA